MLRDPSLAPLSRQHQHALALCVRIKRALAPAAPQQQRGPRAPDAWRREVAQLFEAEIQHHFDAEEQLLFPAARQRDGMEPLVEKLLAEHSQLRSYVQQAQAGTLDEAGLVALAELLSAHIRSEEGELFETMQRAFSAAELAALGEQTAAFFMARGLTGPACGLP